MEQTDKPAPRKRKRKPPDVSGHLSPRQIIQEKRAALALQGLTYEEIHAQINTGKPVKYPTQTVYSSLATPGGQKALAKVASEFYDEAKLKRKLNELLDKPKTRDGDRIRAIELAMRSLAMLTDKQESKVTTEQVSHRTMERLAEDTLSDLAVSSDGITSKQDIAENSAESTLQITDFMSSKDKVKGRAGETGESQEMPIKVHSPHRPETDPTPYGEGDSEAG